MKLSLREQLTAQARAYAAACAQDLIAARYRADVASRILEYAQTDRPIGDCPTPRINESAGKAERYGARVDALILALWNETEEP